MKTILLSLVLIAISGCSTVHIKANYYPVEPLTKSQIFGFSKKAEYENKDEETTKNALIVYCSKSLSSNGYKVLSRVVKPEDVMQVVAGGGVLVTTHPEVKETKPGIYEKSLYLKFESLGRKGIISPIYAVKVTKTDDRAFSLEDIEDLCNYAIKKIPEHQPTDI